MAAFATMSTLLHIHFSSNSSPFGLLLFGCAAETANTLFGHYMTRQLSSKLHLDFNSHFTPLKSRRTPSGYFVPSIHKLHSQGLRTPSGIPLRQSFTKAAQAAFSGAQNEKSPFLGISKVLCAGKDSNLRRTMSDRFTACCD